MTYMAKGAAWLADKATAAAGESAIYLRDGVSIPITAILGRVQPQSLAIADGRANLEEEPADFLIQPDMIDFGMGPVEPRRGDRIIYAGRVYEAAPRDGEPPFRPDSQYRGLWRVRTIRVS